MNIPQKLAAEFQLRQEQIDNTIALLDDGKTIPFIARYRKERTGSLDDQVLRAIDNRLQYLRKLEQRKEEICTAIEAQGKLTPELEEKIRGAETLVETEDLYLPYRPKRKTRHLWRLPADWNRWHESSWHRIPGRIRLRKQKLFCRRKCRTPKRHCRGQWTFWRRKWQMMPTCESRCVGW